MLSSKTVVLDVEGFRHRKEKIIVKKLGVCTEDYLDCVIILPQTSYSELTTQQKKSFNCLTRNLHGVEWDTRNYPFNYLTKIIQSVRLRNPGAIFYAKGEEKVKFLSDLLECSIIDLNSLARVLMSAKGRKHCAKEKAIFFFNWLTNERAIDESGSNLITEFNNLHLDYGERDSECFNFQRRNPKNCKPVFTENVKLLLTEDENRSFTQLVYYIELFFQWKKHVKNSTRSLSSETLTDVEAPGW